MSGSLGEKLNRNAMEDIRVTDFPTGTPANTRFQFQQPLLEAIVFKKLDRFVT
jgi:hypothetical protein